MVLQSALWLTDRQTDRGAGGQNVDDGSSKMIVFTETSDKKIFQKIVRLLKK
jgi:hypothetical protein